MYLLVFEPGRDTERVSVVETHGVATETLAKGLPPGRVTDVDRRRHVNCARYAGRRESKYLPYHLKEGVGGLVVGGWCGCVWLL